LAFGEERLHLRVSTEHAQPLEQRSRRFEQPGFFLIDGAGEGAHLVALGRLCALDDQRLGPQCGLIPLGCGDGLQHAPSHLSHRSALRCLHPARFIGRLSHTRQQLCHAPRDASEGQRPTQLTQRLEPASEAARSLYPAHASVTTLERIRSHR
jgi:hypothetical protein